LEDQLAPTSCSSRSSSSSLLFCLSSLHL